ncbi:MAG: UDP-N-acetylmuramate dehydrogenase [Bacteroidales bacterium]|nr:UDP-N-acetylmuramate dehydrogenase [Bacteroidales bacterium]
MEILRNISLKKYNTFGIDVKSAYLTELSSEKELPYLLNWIEKSNLPYYLLSGGSNVLFVSDYPGIIIRVNMKGIQKVDETDDHVFIQAMAGENWEDFVDLCLKNNWGGIENLTLIPGNVGTSPMQNIGAYGMEIKDSFHHLKALELKTGEIKTFNSEQCRFGYRESFFKNEGRDKYMILSVCFRLSRRNHVLNTTYGIISQELEKIGVKQPGLYDVANVIRSIRRSKLPDPAELGNAGSFFKNPLITQGHFNTLVSEYPEIPGFPDVSGNIKTAAAWFIDKAGWKGYRDGDSGVHKMQALVLVNYGKASGNDILSLSEKIQKSVKEKFDVNLEREVNVVGDFYS